MESEPLFRGLPLPLLFFGFFDVSVASPAKWWQTAWDIVVICGIFSRNVPFYSLDPFAADRLSLGGAGIAVIAIGVAMAGVLIGAARSGRGRARDTPS